MSNEFISETKNGVTTITINRPDDGNKVSDPMAVELTRMLNEASNTSQVIVLRGAGADFCLGRAQMGRNAPATPPEALDLRDGNEVVFNAYGAFRKSKAPVVAVVQGQALGFGCALASAADVTLAADTALFQLPEMGHNIMPTMAMSSMIDRAHRKAIMYMTWSTEKIEAETALAYGIVSRVVPATKLGSALETLLAAMTKAPQPAVRAVKEFTRTAYTMDIEGANDYAQNLHAVINTSSRMRRGH
jgi:enoyl-CoA hydratase/carnithine racemase